MTSVTDPQSIHTRLSTAPGPDSFDVSLANALFGAAVDSILVINARGLIQTANKAALLTFGYTQQELVGQNISLLMPTQDAKAHDGYMDNYEQTGKRKIIGIGRELKGKRKNGELFPLHLSIGEFQLQGQKMFVGICHDISDRQASSERMAALATYDSLTGCINRHQFLERLTRAMDECRAKVCQIAVLFIDLDRFKQINDNHGHLVGDQLLRQAVTRLRTRLRDTDCLGRVGGDEFVVALHVENGQPDLHQLATRLIDSLAEPFKIGDRVLSVGASVGISLFPEHGQSADELVNAADIAMYQAKRSAAGICLFDQSLRERTEQEYRLLGKLRNAIALNRLELHYQLQFDLQTLRPTGMEALLRWRSDEGELIPPDTFIPVARINGLMPSIGRWVVRQVCQDNLGLIHSGMLDVPAAANVCTEFFSQAELLTVVRQELANSGLPADRLELEITEDTAMDSAPQVTANASALAELGVCLAMDDFGVGFSSLGRLKTLRFNKIKIDRSFVAGLPSNDADQVIIKAILGVARELGMQCIAEGIETEQQLAWLRENGCNLGQGYWYARPVPLSELQRLLPARSASYQAGDVNADLPALISPSDHHARRQHPPGCEPIAGKRH